MCSFSAILILRWRHNGCDSVSNHQPHHCLLNRLFRRRSKKTSKLGVTGLCAGNSPGTGEFPAQMASNAEKVFIWWRHHDFRAFEYIKKGYTVGINSLCHFNDLEMFPKWPRKKTSFNGVLNYNINVKFAKYIPHNNCNAFARISKNDIFVEKYN